MTIRAKLLIAAAAIAALAAPALAGDFVLYEVDVYTNYDAVLLNPQPLPPKVLYDDYTYVEEDDLYGDVAFGEEVMLNPQPLPPGERYSDGYVLGEEVMLNPQPLPPRELYLEDLMVGY